MRSSHILGLMAILLLFLAGPNEAAAQPDCTFCKQCTSYPERFETDPEEITIHDVLEIEARCRTQDEYLCGDLIPCSPTAPAEEELSEAELAAAVSAGDHRKLKKFLASHPDQVETILERNLVLFRRATCRGERIVGVYQVPDLRTVLLE